MAALGLMCLYSPTAPASAQESQEREYALKAGFIYNFTRFVQWPEPARSRLRDKELVFCVAGADPFGDALGRMAEKFRATGRGFRLVRGASLETLQQCHILFINASEDALLETILKPASRLPLLTVSDAPGFALRGVGINFFVENNRIRFEINRRAVEAAGLSISSELLDLARIIEGGSP